MFIKFYQSKRHWRNRTRSKVTPYILYWQQSFLLSCVLAFGEAKLFNMIDCVQPESNNARNIFSFPVLRSLTITQISAYRRLLCPITYSFRTFCRFEPTRCTVYSSQLCLRDFLAFMAFFLKLFNWSLSIDLTFSSESIPLSCNIVERCTFVELSYCLSSNLQP